MGAGQDRDERVLHHVADEFAQQRARFLAGGEQVPELRHPPAEKRALLDQRDLHATVGQVAGRGEAGDAAADHERRRVDGDAPLAEGDQVAGAVDRGPHQARRLRGRRVAVLDDPGHVLADVDVLEEVLVQPRALDRAPERHLVQRRRAGGHHNTVEGVLADLLLDERLPRVGAVEHVRGGEHHVGHPRRVFRHAGDIDHVGDVPAAVANEHPDSRRRNLRRRHVPTGTSRVEHGRTSAPRCQKVAMEASCGGPVVIRKYGNEATRQPESARLRPSAPRANTRCSNPPFVNRTPHRRNDETPRRPTSPG